MSLSPRSRPPPRTTQRDRPDTEFSNILRRFFERHEKMRAAVFVDSEGECVDYCALLDPFDTKVFGATWLSTHNAMLRCMERLHAGQLRQWTVEGQTQTLVVRRVTDEYSLLVLLDAEGVTAHVLQDLVEVAHQLRSEAGIRPASWEVQSDPWIARER